MKKIFLLSAVLFVVATSCDGGKKSPHQVAEGKEVSVIYGRPYKKDREIFGKLVPYGQVWRCGADEATEITFDKDVQFAGKSLKAGTYTMFVIPNPTEWTIILNSQLEQFGAFDYEKHKDKDVLQVMVPVKKPAQTIEQHTIRFTDANIMVIEWDQTQVEVPITAA